MKRGDSLIVEQMAPPSDGGSLPTSPLHTSPSLAFEVKSIDYTAAKEIIETYHYSHRMPHGKNVCFGAFIGEELYAVAVYGTGVNMVAETYLSRITGLKVNRKNLSELKRLARKGDRGDSRISLTRFLAICHRILAKDMDIKFIYSFSDPMHSHDGTIYKAANFIYLGKTQEEIHYTDPTGRVVHRRVPYRYTQNSNITKVQEDPERKKRWQRRCEYERQQKDEQRVNGRRWSTVTLEIKARQAKKMLEEEGEYVFTFARARQNMQLTKLKTEAKNRWFLPLIGRDRNQLLEGKPLILQE